MVLLGVLAIIVGIIAIAWPAPTALVLVVGIWAFIGGIFEIAAAFQSGQTAGTRALLSLFSLIYGVSQVTMGAQLRRTGNTLHSG